MNSTSINTKNSDTIATFFSSGQLPHAILIEGVEGIGRLDFAKYIASGIVCEDALPPCGQCKHCKKAQKDIHPDIIFASGLGGANSFHVDDVRKIRMDASVMPNEAARKVFVLDNAQELTIGAQNALLKVIEEPPNGVHFILICDNRSLLLETILSRVQVFTMQQGDKILPPDQAALDILTALCGGNELAALASLNKLQKDRAATANMLANMKSIADSLVATPKRLPVELVALQARLTLLQRLQIIDIIDQMSTYTAQNVSGALLCTAICSKIKQCID